MFMFAGAPIQHPVDVKYVAGNTTEVHSDFADPEPGTDIVDTLDVNPTDTIATKNDNQEDPEPVEPPKPKGPAHVKSKFSDFPAYIPPGIKVDDGRKILCFFAPGCEHCQNAAKELTEMRNEIPNMPPMHIVFMDEEVNLIPKFFEIAGREYSHTVAPVTEFWKMLDFSRDTPGICYLYNGNIMYFADGINEKEFEKADLKKALAKEM